MTEVQIITPPVADETDALDHGLVTLTRAICQAHPELEGGYGLGGEFGYGENFENDVFSMRRYYWGDCDCGYQDLEDKWCKSHNHGADCYQTELAARTRAARLPYWDGNKWQNARRLGTDAAKKLEDQIYNELCLKHGKDREFGAAVHCSCSYEVEWKAWAAANEHKPTCTPQLPNFLHKRTGLEVRWYKWIGRGIESKNADGADLQAIFAECLATLSSHTRAEERHD